MTATDPFNPLSLTGRTILVTGASSGIGQATAVYLSKLGARIVVTGRNVERLEVTLGLLHGSDHIVRSFDLADTTGIVGWLKALCAEIGPLNGIAHCAGIQNTLPIQAISPAFVQDVLSQNLAATLMLAQAFRLRACHTPSAALVLVASSAAIRSAPGNVVYAASKGGMISAAKGLGVELLRDGIRVNAVAPGMVETPMSEQFKIKISEERFQKVIDMHPLGLGQPDDVAAAIAFLLADTSRWITGAVLSVDGGFTA
jgi:NAD(P)-dependent dehydrogenase (short-subunit alcohol dehydrogenase family)